MLLLKGRCGTLQLVTFSVLQVDEDNEAALDLQCMCSIQTLSQCEFDIQIFSEQQINSEVESTVTASLHLPIHSLPMEHSAMYLTLFTQQHTHSY